MLLGDCVLNFVQYWALLSAKCLGVHFFSGHTVYCDL